jgi:hypothetical protein
MTLFDDFIANSAILEAELWQIVEDHNLMEQQGWIEDCMMRDFAGKLKNEYPQFGLVNIVFIMDKLYVACLKSLALKGREYNKAAKRLVLANLTLEQDNASLKSQLTALTEENSRLRMRPEPIIWL